jgi:hypothetical protein
VNIELAAAITGCRQFSFYSMFINMLLSWQKIKRKKLQSNE